MKAHQVPLGVRCRERQRQVKGKMPLHEDGPSTHRAGHHSRDWVGVRALRIYRGQGHRTASAHAPEPEALPLSSVLETRVLVQK